MKKSVKIILFISGILIVLGIYIGYMIYTISYGGESLSGEVEKIPVKVKPIPPITSGDSDWTNWRGTDYKGKSLYKGIRPEWTGGLKKRWQVNYLCQDKSTASWAAPVIKGNRIVVPGRDEKNDIVFCLDSENGDLIWMGSYESDAGESHGPGARATPFIDEERVYTFGRSGDLVCWHLENGKMIWRKNVKDVGGEEPEWGFSSSPLVNGNRVVVQAGGNALVVAYDKLSGDMLWKSMKGRVGYAAVVPIRSEGEDKVIIYHGTGLSCLNSSDGRELWSLPWETDYGVNATTPLISNDTIFHSSAYKMGCQAVKITSEGYTILWKNNLLQAQHTDPVIIDGYIYGYSGESMRNTGEFKCIELKTGREMWSTGDIGQGTVTYVDGFLICLDIKGNLYLIKPDPMKFNKISEIRNAINDVKSPAWTVPVVANGKLYLRYLQQLVCYDLKDR